jgi:DNA-binding response OmpR family regulator
MNDLKLDSDTYQVFVKGYRVQLTSTEHRLLRYLMENPNRALSPGHLLQAVWEYPPNTGDPDLVRAHVRNLRAKIEKNTDRRYIRTIHGVGYMISA